MINKWKDPWFYYKVIAATAILASILGVYLYHMINQKWTRTTDYPFSYLLFQGNFISYFTYQSNIIVGVWFLIAAIYHNKKNKMIDNQNITLAITCYITITCCTFLIVIVPVAVLSIFKTSETFNAEVVLGAIFFHVLVPASMIIYTLTHAKPMKMTAKEYYHKSFWLYLIYPWLYTLYLALRLIIYSTVPSLKSMPLILVYPYLPGFPDYNVLPHITNNQLNIILMVIFFVFVHIGFVLFNFMYFYSIKKLSQKKKKQHKTEKKSK